MRHLALSLTLSVLLGACAANEAGPPDADRDTLEREVDAAEVQRFARDFRSWGALDQTLRIAPTLCRAPAVSGDRTMRESDAVVGPHGRKLYRLHARDAAAYRGVESGAPQAHQVLVKEAFEAQPFEMPGPGRVPSDVVSTEGGLVRPGAPAGLFLMFRGAGEGEGEHLWTYATVAPSGEITGVGRLEACIACHRDAPFGGLFGIDPPTDNGGAAR